MSNVVFFDGVDDYVTPGTNVAVFKMGSGSFSISVRAKSVRRVGADKTALFGVAVGGGTSRYQLSLYNLNGTFGWSLKDDAGNIIETYPSTTATEAIDNRWHYFSVIFNRTSNNAYLYKDGFLVNTTSIAAIVGTVNPIGISLISSSAFGAGMLDGYVSEVQLYNRALSDDEILYNNSHPNNPKRRGLVLNLTQDSIYGPTWLDLSGNANNGTYVGGAVPVTNNRLAGR